MDNIEVIMLVCQILNPQVCEERHVPIQFQGPLSACVWQAQPHIAQWTLEHPKYVVKKWRCGIPGADGQPT
ncbi:hypothetical protein [Methylobrevis pamukkalensis]|uniref:Uncharacterized protein n=1 Tax=Methylobrevis pamukkalensis TaxID=1439726 RepID=A0A1E3H288_9HYPH|nr:hypothetical protein [Methylobrevis pamukkalensis]ODN69916.1 hypothetical protein A6302_02742 [Methylobrevis pamukkalensis]